MNNIKILGIGLMMLLGVMNAGASNPEGFGRPAIKIDGHQETVSDVTGYLVSDNGRNRMTPRKLNFEENISSSVDGVITINTSERYQPIDGFGFAITGSTAYNLMHLEPRLRKSLLTQVFSRENGFGCSYVRVSIGCSDYSLSNYTCCDTPELENFGLTSEETELVIPILKEILEINPGLKVMGSPWTAPLWIKNNGEWTGGNIKEGHYKTYGDYFVKWIQAMNSHSIPIYSVTLQNEPLNWGNSASMYMAWHEAVRFLKEGIGPAFRDAGLSTKIYIWDHNYDYGQDNEINREQNDYVAKVLGDADAAKYVSGSGWHRYEGGTAAEMGRVHNNFPDKELMFTEWSAGDWTWPAVGIGGVTTDAQSLIFDVLNNWGRGSLGFNLLLDDKHGPYRPGGCDNGDGAVTVNRDGYNVLNYNSFYYVMCLAASATTASSRRIGNSITGDGLQSIAFDNGDGRYGVVVMNRADEDRVVRIKSENGSFIDTLPAKSMASYRF